MIEQVPKCVLDIRMDLLQLATVNSLSRANAAGLLGLPRAVCPPHPELLIVFCFFFLLFLHRNNAIAEQSICSLELHFQSEAGRPD